ncbi:hypothetical protein BA6E_1215 [Bacteroidales bacterium 6E]|nr:hypothetical protein BA6E_1215 [Bacteroidales bacterium 6E]
MEILEIKRTQEVFDNVKLREVFLHFKKLLVELRKRNLPDGLVMEINKSIEELNNTPGSAIEQKRLIRKKQSAILKLLDKEMKLVPSNYYRNLWLVLGMVIFGLPTGVVFGTILGSMGFIGMGLPIGMPIGMAMGMSLDKKALTEGRQLDWETKD